MPRGVDFWLRVRPGLQGHKQGPLVRAVDVDRTPSATRRPHSRALLEHCIAGEPRYEDYVAKHISS